MRVTKLKVFTLKLRNRSKYTVVKRIENKRERE